MQNEGVDVSEYMNKAATAGVTAVAVQDVSALRDYLTGKIEDCPQIDHTSNDAASTTNST